jgi:hypothetical protein
MRAARLLALRAARPRSGQLAAAGSQASALSSAVASAGYNALRAARARQDWPFDALDSSLPASSSPAPRAPARAAVASAGGPFDGSASFGGGRSEQSRVSRSVVAPPFSQHVGTCLSGSGAGGRAAEAGLPAASPSRLTSAASALLGGWPSLLAQARGLAAMSGPEALPQLSAGVSSADDGAGSESEARRPVLLLRPSRATVLGGRWSLSRAAAAPPDRFGAVWSAPSRQFSTSSGAAAGDAASNQGPVNIGVKGVQLKRSPASLPRFQSTTGVFHATGTFSSLTEFVVATDDTDPTAFILLDSPGMGKTVTVEEAAKAAGAIFARFLGSNGVMHSAQKQIERGLEAEAARSGGLVDPFLAEKIGIKAWKLALAACMDRCREQMQTRGRLVRLIELNGVSFDTSARTAEEIMADARTALLATVASGAEAGRWAADAPILLHFDEIQALLADNERPQDRRPPAPSSPAACMRYMLVWFSSALREVCAGYRFKPVITGISVDTMSSMRFDSSIKKWPIEPLPYFSLGKTRALLQEHLTFASEQEEALVARGVAGCPRAVQHLFLVAKQRAEALARGDILPDASCSDLVEAAGDSWRQAGSSAFLKGQSRHLAAAEEAFLATCFPGAWGAKAAAVDGVPVAVMALDALPASWREAADAGVIRLRMNSEVATIFPPYPFLERYLRTLGTRLFSFSSSLDLVMSARVLPRASGALGRGKAFEFATALELCLPGNRLLQHILGCPQLKPLGLKPRARVVVPLTPFASPTLGPVVDEIRLVVDGSSVAKPGDIAVPVLVPDGQGGYSDAWLVVQVKSSLADTPDYVRAGLASFLQRMDGQEELGLRLSCYLTTIDPQSRSARPVAAVSDLEAFNAAQADRRMGLVVLTDELLSSCALPLAEILQSEDTADRTAADWIRTIFTDEAARDRIACELRHLADDITARRKAGKLVVDDSSQLRTTAESMTGSRA